MSRLDVRLLAVAGPPIVPAAHLVEACRAAAAGATAIQVRIKHAPAGELFRLTAALRDALPVPVYVNDRADVAWAAGARGVHVGAGDLAPALIRRFAPHPFQIGVSVGTAAEADQARRDDVDYWSIGAVYATATKPDAGSPIGVAGFRTLAALAPAGMPVIAIGGINATNAADVFAVGAAGIAVGSAIFAAADATAAARALREIVEEYCSEK